MDPLLLEALRFGLAILAGGIVAVVSSLLSFRYAERARLNDAKRQDAALLRALLSEIEENLIRLQPPKPEGLEGGVVTPDAPALESAWLLARALELSVEQRAALGRAYGFASSYNGELVLLNARLADGGGRIGGADTSLLSNLMIAADRAVKAFEAARDALRPLV